MTSARASLRLPSITVTNTVSFRLTTTTTTTTTTSSSSATSSAITSTTISTWNKPAGQSSVLPVAGADADVVAAAVDCEAGSVEGEGECERGGEERRVGRHLIDTPTDPGSVFRQSFLSFRLAHRGVGKVQNESLPEVPYRLTPKVDLPQLSTMNRPSPILRVDVATSPIHFTHDDSDLKPSQTLSPTPSTARSVTFMTEPEVTSEKVKGQEVKKDVQVGKRRSSQDVGKRMSSVGTSTELMTKRKTVPGFTKSVSFMEQAEKASGKRNVRQCSKLTILSFSGDPPPCHMMGNLPDLAEDPLSKVSFRCSRQKSCSLPDLTDVGPLSLWNDRDTGSSAFNTPRAGQAAGAGFNTPRGGQVGVAFNTPRGGQITWDNSGTSHVLHNYHRSKTLLDLMKEQEVKVTDPTSYHKKQRIAHFAFRRDNSFSRSNSLSGEDADKEWLDVVTGKMVEGQDYDKFASRRKPAESSKKSSKAFPPKVCPHGNGKVFPVFFNDGLPVRKFGRTKTKHKPAKSKS